MYDSEIMDELLKQPDVAENIKYMTPDTLEWFKELLVSQGIYAKYVEERKVT
jgi:hypothetical protein